MERTSCDLNVIERWTNARTRTYKTYIVRRPKCSFLAYAHRLVGGPCNTCIPCLYFVIQIAMSVPRRFIGTQFPVSNVSTEEVGWRGRLSKWQWALAIGLPLVGAAAVAGLTLWISRRKRAVTDRDRSPAPSLSSTPVASPSPTVVKTAADTNSKDGVSSN